MNTSIQIIADNNRIFQPIGKTNNIHNKEHIAQIQADIVCVLFTILFVLNAGVIVVNSKLLIAIKIRNSNFPIIKNDGNKKQIAVNNKPGNIKPKYLHFELYK